MTALGVDLSSNNATFDFAAANAEGCRTGYIKLGGDNLSPTYFSPSYTARVDGAHAVGWPVGSYWITGGHNPDAAALFMTAHLEAFGPADYIVLDNEPLDDGNVYDDAEAAEWVRAAAADSGHPTSRVLHYASKSLMESHEWPELLATGCMFIIADYNGTPFVNHVPSTIPADRIVGHQYADNGSIGGAYPVDLNAFTDAFLNSLTLTNGNDVFDNDAQAFLNNIAADIKQTITQGIASAISAEQRESRGRLFYCPTPPAGLPQFVVIFENRNPGAHNVLYCNDGEIQAAHLGAWYGQTGDSVAQAKAAPDTPAQFATRIALALGTDSAFTNKLAATPSA